MSSSFSVIGSHEWDRDGMTAKGPKGLNEIVSQKPQHELAMTGDEMRRTFLVSKLQSQQLPHILLVVLVGIIVLLPFQHPCFILLVVILRISNPHLTLHNIMPLVTT